MRVGEGGHEIVAQDEPRTLSSVFSLGDQIKPENLCGEKTTLPISLRRLLSKVMILWRKNADTGVIFVNFYRRKF